MQTQFHIIYKTIHANGKYYIGRHSTNNLDDGYLGSGKWVQSIKDKTSLSRLVLIECNTYEELVNEERRILKEVIDDPLNMNYSNASIGFSTGNLNPAVGRVGSWNKGKTCPSISKGRKAGKKPNITTEKRSEITKSLWESGVYDNRPVPTEEHKQKISVTMTGRQQSEYQKQRVKEVHTGKIYGKETREKIRHAAILRESIIVTCPHCNKVGNGPAMKRWHFTNCKHINSVIHL